MHTGEAPSREECLAALSHALRSINNGDYSSIIEKELTVALDAYGIEILKDVRPHEVKEKLFLAAGASFEVMTMVKDHAAAAVAEGGNKASEFWDAQITSLELTDIIPFHCFRCSKPHAGLCTKCTGYPAMHPKCYNDCFEWDDNDEYSLTILNTVDCPPANSSLCICCARDHAAQCIHAIVYNPVLFATRTSTAPCMN
jgi:hypothetical protein